VWVWKNFLVWKVEHRFVFVGLLWFLVVVWVLLGGVLWCVSAWFVVRFDVGCGAHRGMLLALREIEFHKKKAPIPLHLLLPSSRVGLAECWGLRAGLDSCR